MRRKLVASFWVALVSVAVVGGIIYFGNRDQFADPENSYGDTTENVGAASISLHENSMQIDHNKQPISRNDKILSARVEPSIEAFSPIDVYTQYEEHSESGDLVSTAVLLTVMEGCRQTDNTDFIDTIRRSSLSLENQELEVQRYERCESLAEHVSNFADEEQRLRQILRQSQHPLLLIRQRSMSVEKKRELLIEVILDDLPEMFLYERAFVEAAVYHRDRPDIDSKYREEAWLVLYCEASLQCDGQVYRDELMNSKYLEHEFNQILKIELAIRSAIANKNADGLGF